MTNQEKNALYSVLLRLIDDGDELSPTERRDLMNTVTHACCGMTADDILNATENNRKLRIKRGTTAENNEYTGLIGEITMDTDMNTLRVHDGIIAGGHMVAGTEFVIEVWRASDGSAWYRKYNTGRVDMGGCYTGNATTVTLPVTLANADYQIMLQKVSTPSSWATTHIAVSERTTTGFIVTKYGDNASMQISWLILNALCAA